jgi:hypothetical protein
MDQIFTMKVNSFENSASYIHKEMNSTCTCEAVIVETTALDNTQLSCKLCKGRTIPHWSKSSDKPHQSPKASQHTACIVNSALTGDKAQTPHQHRDLAKYGR